MRKCMLPAVFLLLGLFAAAQKDSIRVYLDEDLNFTNRKNSVYPALAVRSADHWVLYAVYPDTSILLKIFYKDAGLRVKDGPFTLYHPKRIIAQNGYFHNNIASGRWQTYYPNGQIKEDGSILNNHFSGEWKIWYENGQLKSSRNYIYRDSTAAGDPVHEFSPANVNKILDGIAFEGLLQGPATDWYQNGGKQAEMNYQNDTLTGTCSWYRPNGQPSSRETYANGKIIELACYDSSGKYTGATCSILKMPVLIHPVFDALGYLEYELHKEKNKDIKEEGEALVKFTVTKKGTIENLRVTDSPDAALSRHITQIFAGMPGWSPAVVHNQAIDYPMALKIPYYRQ